MQAIQSLVLSAGIGIILGFFPIQGFGTTIWTSLNSGDNFSFANYDQVFLAVTLHKDEADRQLLDLIKSGIGKNGNLLALKDPQEQIMGAMAESKLWLHIALISTENPNTHLLHLYASVGGATTLNKTPVTAKVWERWYLFEGKKDLDQDIQKALQKSIPPFLAQYFSTNPQAKGKATFYFPSPGS